jgi:hypothetical protein
MGNPVGTALEGAKKALESANRFTSSVAGGKPNAFAPKPEVKKPERSDYSHVRETRKTPEFMGVRSDEAPEINTALAARETAKKALEQ